MKIGIKNNLYFFQGTMKTDYNSMKKHGYDCGDYQNLAYPDSDFYTISEADAKKRIIEEKKQADSVGITYSQVHCVCPYFSQTAEQRRLTLEQSKRAAWATSLLGAKYLVVHPLIPFGKENEDAILAEQINETFFRELCSYAEKFGVVICAENLPWTKLKLSPIENLLDFVNRLDISNLKLCLDTGHANVFGTDCGDMIRLCKDKIKTLHVHDNWGDRDNHLMPYFGTINWDSFKSALKETGFDGCISTEADIGRSLPESEMEYMKIALANITKTLAEY